MPEKLVCPYCGHVWPPRVKDPVSCPKCKRHLAETSIQKAKRLERERRREALLLQRKETQCALIEHRESVSRLENTAYITCSHPNCMEPAWFRYKHAKDAKNLCKEHIIEYLEELNPLSFDSIMNPPPTQ